VHGRAAGDEDRVLRVGDVDFYCAAFATGRKPDGCLPVLKHPDNVERYVELSAQIRPKIVVELGIARGGSTALLNELFGPDTLVALEIGAKPVQVLTQYIESHGMSSAVRPHYGVDQSDRETVARIVSDEIGDRPIDLVIDDASHRYAETRSSFETLFPRVRPGGLFIIEDWNVDQLMGDAIDQARRDPSSPHHDAIVANDAKVNGSAARVAPLTQLAVELILIRGSMGDAVREVIVNENWVVVERGEAHLDPDAWRLSDHVRDHHFGLSKAVS
jgi:cephalosporin hydroxylase